MTDPLRRRLLAASLLAAVISADMLSSTVRAAEAALMQASISIAEPGEKPGLFINSSFEFDLPQPLSEALHSGFRLYNDRWYWFDKIKAESRFVIRLAFDPLTRRYRLSYNGLSHSFDTLEQALPYIKNIRRWRVAPSNLIRSAEDYKAEIRFFLDTEKLPKPMQVVNTGSSEWTVSSGWESVPIPADAVVPEE